VPWTVVFSGLLRNVHSHARNAPGRTYVRAYVRTRTQLSPLLISHPASRARLVCTAAPPGDPGVRKGDRYRGRELPRTPAARHRETLTVTLDNR